MQGVQSYRRLGWLLVFWAVALFSSAASARGRLPDFSELVEKNSPVVVNISTTQVIKNKGIHGLPPGLEIPDLPENSPFGELFKRFFGEGEAPIEREARSLGSGFIISEDGYIITNNHVVEGAEEIVVKLASRDEYTAKVVGTDKRSDIALLKIDAKGLPVARIGSSEKMKVGEWVLAIGSPFGFENSATAGIISAKGRALPSENYIPFIQTDVAINPGNSGGPLFNMDGEVIGVNSQIYSRTGGYMGLSFAIPIEVAMNVVEQLRTKGHVTRGWLGVLIQDVNRELARSFGLKKPEGALISKVLKDSPAARAGLQVGDVILEFNGHHIDRSADLPPIVGNTPVGKRVPVKVMRNGRIRTIEVTLGELKEEKVAQLEQGGKKAAIDNRLGMVVAPVPDDIREALEIGEGGVIVKRLENGPAARAGIRKGDVITLFDGKKVKGPHHFEKLVAELKPGDVVPVLVQRENGPLFLAIRIPKQGDRSD
ncbi:MAG: DegQ family serine endoprotease [Gammaproteobacteria bacterium]|nr:MAG: DegQ family serine endoprotease [Gammaproteobacteria bacterium]